VCVEQVDRWLDAFGTERVPHRKLVPARIAQHVREPTLHRRHHRRVVVPADEEPRPEWRERQRVRIDRHVVLELLVACDGCVEPDPNDLVELVPNRFAEAVLEERNVAVAEESIEQRLRWAPKKN
jgi:hypothetical protein